MLLGKTGKITIGWIKKGVLATIVIFNTIYAEIMEYKTYYDLTLFVNQTLFSIFDMYVQHVLKTQHNLTVFNSILYPIYVTSCIIFYDKC